MFELTVYVKFDLFMVLLFMIDEGKEEDVIEDNIGSQIQYNNISLIETHLSHIDNAGI